MCRTQEKAQQPDSLNERRPLTLAEVVKCHEEVNDENCKGITLLEWKNQKGSQYSSSENTDCSPKESALLKTPAVIEYRETATPSTCASSQLNSSSYHMKQPLNVNVLTTEKRKSCMRNLNEYMADAQKSRKSKDELYEESYPTDNVSEYVHEIDFDIEPIPVLNSMYFDLDELVPLNQFVSEQESNFDFSFYESEFSPMGDCQLPLSLMY